MNNIWNKYSEVQSAILYEYVLQTFETLWMKEIAHRKQYRFQWRRMHVANTTKVLNERECLSGTKLFK